jgi:hypothetical protein
MILSCSAELDLGQILPIRLERLDGVNLALEDPRDALAQWKHRMPPGSATVAKKHFEKEGQNDHAIDRIVGLPQKTKHSLNSIATKNTPF